MSFLNITDPKKRDTIVKEYLATIQRIKNRNILERTQGFENQELVEESLEPVVRSNVESTEAITKELIPIKEGIIALNDKLHKPVEEKKEEDSFDGNQSSMIERIYQAFPDKIDRYFGIVRDGSGRYKMGDTYVYEDSGDILANGLRYEGTRGLWNLVMMRSPKSNYTDQDLRNYRDLVLETNVMKKPNNVDANSRPTTTTKWQRIFPLFDTMDHEEKWEDEDGNHNEDETQWDEDGNKVAKEGQGIFLPSDIKSLRAKLSYLLAEFRAGNTSATRNQIVAIADNLLKRKKISKGKYRKINNYISQ